MLSILISLLKKPNSYQNLYLAALVNSQGEIIQAAMMTPPHNLLLTQTSEDFISHIILNALEESIPIPGVLGPNTSGLEFSVFMRSKAGKNFHLERAQRTFKLTKVNWPSIPEGHFRQAIEKDRDLLIQFGERFMIETGIPSHLTAQQQVEHLIDSGLLYVWESESGGIVSMAAKVYGDTPNGQRISWVYTAPKSRGKGYASSVVAFLSQKILFFVHRFEESYFK